MPCNNSEMLRCASLIGSTHHVAHGAEGRRQTRTVTPVVEDESALRRMA